MSRNKKIICLLLLIAIIPRVISLITFDFIDSGGGSDSVTYLLLARNLFTGHGYTEFGLPHTIHHPFYPIMIGLVWQLVGDLLLSAQLISCLAGILLVVPVYLITSSMFGRRTGFLAVLMIALFPILVYGSTESFTESLYTFLLISGLAAGWLSFQSGSIFRPIFSGVFLGLSFLTHPLGVSFLPLVVGFNLLAGRRRSWIKERIRTALLILGAFILTCLPFWLHLHSVTGNWQLSGSSHYQDFGLRYDQVQGVAESKIIFENMEALFAPGVRAEPDRDHQPMGMTELILKHPDRFLQIIRLNIIDGYHEAVKTARYLSLPPIVLFAVLSLGFLILMAYFFSMFIRGHRRAAMSYLTLMFMPMWIFLIIIIEHRYFYAFIPLALIIFSRIIVDIWEIRGWRTTPWRIFIVGISVYYLALAMGSTFVVFRKAVKTGVPYEYKILGRWMKDNIPGIEEEKVMMFRLGISYYAGCDWNVFYWGGFPGLKDYLKKRGINFLEVDSYKLHMIHPDLRFLLTADPLPPDFSLVREVEFDGRKIRLLKFHPAAE